MTIVLAVLQWLHVFCAIFWFGSALFSDFILIPAIQKLPGEVQTALGRAIAPRSARVIGVVSVLTILLGIVRGLAGTIRGTDVLLGTTYGLTWLVALALGLMLLYVSHGLITPALNRLGHTEIGDSQFATRLRRVQVLLFSELGFFLVILALMIAMRFGY